MYKSIFRLFSTVMLVTLILSACQPKAEPTSEAAAPVPAANLTQDQILTLGVVSNDPAGSIEGSQPLADYLAKQLSDLGIVQGNVVVTPDLATMVEKFRSGEVDLYYESAYGALYVYENAGAVPLLRGWRNKIGEYHSTIFVRKDSGIDSVAGLQGKLIAFAEPESTSGYFLPKAFLISSGLSLSEKSSASTIAEGEVGYVFSGSDENVTSFILLGTAAGGALEYDVYDALKQEDKDKLTVLAQTEDVPRSMMMASSTMNSSIRQRIITVLKDAANSEEGKAVLKSAKKTMQFDDFPLGPQGTMEFLQKLFAPVK